MKEPPDPRSPMTPEEEAAFERWDASTGAKVDLYCAKSWVEHRDFNDLFAELLRLGSPTPDSGHEFWRVKRLPAEEPWEDELFERARRKALELRPRVTGLDWVTLATQLHEGEVADEALRLFPDQPNEPPVGAGLVFFYLRGLIS